jgi:CheY-like chemotaxis protein
MGLKTLRQLQGTPYMAMKEQALWPEERVNALMLDDMSAIFSGVASYNTVEQVITDGNQQPLYFKANRVPLYGKNKDIVGLVIVLTADTSDRKALAEPTLKHVFNRKESTEKLPQSPTVLMIEDNLIAQSVERSLLATLNCRVDIAATGDKAMELFNPGKYDLVLMDISLEDTSGYVVAKQLRHREKDTAFHVPIIALTGYDADVVKYDCGEYFMEGAITKPLTSEQAEQIIKHYVYHMDITVNGLKSIGPESLV